MVNRLESLRSAEPSNPPPQLAQKLSGIRVQTAVLSPQTSIVTLNSQLKSGAAHGELG